MVMLTEHLDLALAAVAVASCHRPCAEGAESRCSRRPAAASISLWCATGPPDLFAVLLFGCYAGVDQRVIDRPVDIELSQVDFVLSSCELLALTLHDAIGRLQPGVLGVEQSHLQDRFEQGRLDCPHYSRPEVLADGRRRTSRLRRYCCPATMRDDRALAPRTLPRTYRATPVVICSTPTRSAGHLSRADEKFLSTLGSAAL